MDENQMKLPVSFIHQSFRYVLGRRTYAVKDWCDWCVANWERIPGRGKHIIMRELEEAFDKNDPNLWLGDKCDIASWVRVRALYKNDAITDAVNDAVKGETNE